MRKFVALLCMASLGITFASDVEAANYGTRRSSTSVQKKSRNPTRFRNRGTNKKAHRRSRRKKNNDIQNSQIVGQNVNPQQRRKRRSNNRNPQVMEENLGYQQNASPSQYGAPRRAPMAAGAAANDFYEDSPEYGDYDQDETLIDDYGELDVDNGYEAGDEGDSEIGTSEESVKQTKKNKKNKNKKKRKRNRNSKKGKKRNRANRNNEESWKHEIPAKKRRRVALDLPSPFVKKSDIKLVASNNTDNKIMITKGLTATPLAPTQSLEKINAKAVKIKREHKMSGNEATRLRQELNMYRELLSNSTNTEKTA